MREETLQLQARCREAVRGEQRTVSAGEWSALAESAVLQWKCAGE